MAAPHNDNIKSKILEGATKLLQTRAFSEISISDIAKSAGVTKGTIYYYYNNKDDLLYDIADGYLDLLYNDLLIWVDNKDKDTSLPRLIRYTLSRGVEDPGKSLRLHLTMDAISGNEYLREKLLSKYESFRSVFVEKLSERQKSGNPEFKAMLLLTVVDGLLIQKLLNNPSLELSSFIEEFIKELSD